MPSKIAPILNYSTRQNVLSNGLALSKQKSSSSFLHDVIFQTFQGLPKQFQDISRMKVLFSSNNIMNNDDENFTIKLSHIFIQSVNVQIRR